MNFIDLIENKNIILWGLTPCLKDKPFENWFNADETRKNMFFSTKGTKEERNEYKRYFNQLLESMCQIKGYKYLSIFDDVFDKLELYLDDIHLDGDMVRELIRSKF